MGLQTIELSKRESILWLIIISECLVYVATMGLLDSSQLLAYISFSSTLVSIILGLLAIIFSVFYSIRNSETTERLNSQLDNLSKVEKEITSTSSIIKNSSDNISKLSQLPFKIEGILKDINELKSNQKRSLELMHEYQESDKKTPRKKIGQDNNKEPINDDEFQKELAIKMIVCASQEFIFLLNELIQKYPDGKTDLSYPEGMVDFIFRVKLQIAKITGFEVDDFDTHRMHSLTMLYRQLNLFKKEDDSDTITISKHILNEKEVIVEFAKTAKETFEQQKEA